jgi:hypothetical protein
LLGVYLLYWYKRCSLVYLLYWAESANTDASSLLWHQPTEGKLVAQILMEDLLQTAYELAEISPGTSPLLSCLTYADLC